jgi:hypothetical protein
MMTVAFRPLSWLLRPTRNALLRLGLLALYLPLVATLDLHHNHGIELPPDHAELRALPACMDPCPVTLFQLAHGDEHVTPPLMPMLASQGAPAVTTWSAPWLPSRRGVAVRGPPRFLPV